jgi:hypothetical protein
MMTTKQQRRAAAMKAIGLQRDRDLALARIAKRQAKLAAKKGGAK